MPRLLTCYLTPDTYKHDQIDTLMTNNVKLLANSFNNSKQRSTMDSISVTTGF